MTTIVAVSDLRDWALHVPGVEVVLAKDYLSEPRWSDLEGVRVFNLCRRYRYQSEGYYVSLLAMARGHTAIPDLNTLLDMRSRTMVRAVDDELEESLQRTLKKIQSPERTISDTIPKATASSSFQGSCPTSPGSSHAAHTTMKSTVFSGVRVPS